MSALPHHPVRAALLYVLAVALFTAQDAASKWLIADYGALQIVALTKLLTLPLLFVVLPRLGGLRALRPRNLGLLVLRALVVFVSLTLFIWALAGLSLPKATTLFFVTPFFVLILSGRFLGETVSAWRYGAVLIGFVGVIIALRPDRTAGDGLFGLDLHGLAVIAAAFLAGVEAIITRRATATDSTPAIMLVSTLVMVVLAGGPALVLFWHPVALTDWPVFLLAAATNIAALYALIEAFRAGQASYLAAFDYSGLAFASLWSVLVFAELPDRATLAGAALIVAAGLMVVRGERRPVT